MKHYNWFKVDNQIIFNHKYRALNPETRSLWIEILALASQLQDHGRLKASYDITYLADILAKTPSVIKAGLKRIQEPEYAWITTPAQGEGLTINRWDFYQEEKKRYGWFRVNNKVVYEPDYRRQDGETRSLFFELLSLASSLKKNGQIDTGNDKKYLESMTRRPATEIKKALKIIEELNWIKMDKRFIFLTNWEKYQSESERVGNYKQGVIDYNNPVIDYALERQERIERGERVRSTAEGKNNAPSRMGADGLKDQDKPVIAEATGAGESSKRQGVVAAGTVKKDRNRTAAAHFIPTKQSEV